MSEINKPYKCPYEGCKYATANSNNLNQMKKKNLMNLI